MKTSEQHIDRVLFVAVVSLMLIGLLLVFSSSAYIADLKYKSALYFFGKHFLRVFIGLFLMIMVIIFLDYKKLRDYAFYVFIATLILLILVLIFGKGSAKRWVTIGFLSFQVSEFAKLGLLIYLSYLIEKNQERLSSFKFGFLPLFFVVAIVTLLVFLQKSFTMAFLIFVLGMILIFLSGVKARYLIFTVALSLPVIILMLLAEPYRFQRIFSHFSPEVAGGNTKHQAVQSLIGLGNGGLFGVGPGHSRQRELYLPLAYNDYIFSILGEEYGFIGSVILIFIFFVIFYRGYRISKYATDEFARFLASGITFMIFLNAVVHIAVASGILPPTGIPLPFVSYGGSAMIANCIGVGILLNISKQANISR